MCLPLHIFKSINVQIVVVCYRKCIQRCTSEARKQHSSGYYVGVYFIFKSPNEESNNNQSSIWCCQEDIYQPTDNVRPYMHSGLVFRREMADREWEVVRRGV